MPPPSPPPADPRALPPAMAAASTPGRGERALLAALFAAGLALRGLYLRHHGVSVDEPQHLHVAWAWAHGLLPYRDVFDNHTPLFSLLLAPLVGRLGQRSDIVLWGRLAMLPLVALTLWATWRLARTLFSPRAGAWAVAIVAVNPDYLLPSIEYRTDQLWAALWCVSLATLVARPLRRGRAFAAGALLGAAFATSMKTSVLALALLVAGAVTLALLARRGARPPARELAALAAAFAAGALVAPAAVAAWVAAIGAWRPFVNEVFGHNVMPGLGLWRRAPWRIALVPVALPLLALAAARLLATAPDAARGARRAFVLLAAGAYYVVIAGAWPLVTRQDNLPFAPLAAALAAPALLALPRLARPGATVARALRLAPALVVVAEMLWANHVEAATRDSVTREMVFLREVVRFTRPDEPFMDLRGESVFRPRPIREVLELITQARIAAGLLPDTIPERLIATRTPAAILDNPELPARTRAFLDSAYVLARGTNLRVAGVLRAAGDTAAVWRFRVRVPQRYAVVCARGPGAGRLDGTPCRGPRELAAGWHTYAPAPGEGRVAAVWAEAVARGARTIP